VKEPPVDGPTFRAATAAIIRAQEMGLDPVEELNRVGLLLTQAQRKRIKLGAMSYLVQELQRWRPAEILRIKFSANRQTTPQDMYVCIVEFFEKHVNAVKEEA
jgi:hypothetical protein